MVKIRNPVKRIFKRPIRLRIRFKSDNFLIRFTHFVIYLNFVVGILYAGIRVFTTPRVEDFFLRRLYAIEAWLIVGFFALYFALTNYPKIRITEERDDEED